MGLALVGCAALARSPHSAQLVGRWRAEAADTGCWVVDRFPDGRYAKKQYLDFDMAKPAELTLEWGHWEIRGGKYVEIIEGATSPTLAKFAGTPVARPILHVTPERFTIEVETYPRSEARERDTRPLRKLPTDAPEGEKKKKVIDTITPALQAVPPWVLGSTS